MRPAKSFEMRSARIAAGCIAMLLAVPSIWAQETKEKVTVDDVNRTFMVRLPRGYDSQRHYPVVILLHGMNLDADDMERLTRFDELADRDGVIAVYPLALHGRWNVGVQPQERSPMTMGRDGIGGMVAIQAGEEVIPAEEEGIRAVVGALREGVDRSPLVANLTRRKGRLLPMT